MLCALHSSIIKIMARAAQCPVLGGTVRMRKSERPDLGRSGFGPVIPVHGPLLMQVLKHGLDAVVNTQFFKNLLQMTMDGPGTDA